MDIKKEYDNDTLIVKLLGRLDSLSSLQLEKELNEINDIKNIIFDLEKLDYVSSAGLRIFLKMQKYMKNRGKMKLIHVCPLVKEVFDFTGFSDILTIE